MISSYFGGSFGNLVSFFAKENKLDIKDIDALLKQVKGEIKPEDQ